MCLLAAATSFQPKRARARGFSRRNFRRQHPQIGLLLLRIYKIISLHTITATAMIGIISIIGLLLSTSILVMSKMFQFASHLLYTS